MQKIKLIPLSKNNYNRIIIKLNLNYQTDIV